MWPTKGYRFVARDLGFAKIQSMFFTPRPFMLEDRFTSGKCLDLSSVHAASCCNAAMSSHTRAIKGF